jgi:hypothetical protein
MFGFVTCNWFFCVPSPRVRGAIVHYHPEIIDTDQQVRVPTRPSAGAASACDPEALVPFDADELGWLIMALVVGRAFWMRLTVSRIMESGTGALARRKNVLDKPELSQASETDYEVVGVGSARAVHLSEGCRILHG